MNNSNKLILGAVVFLAAYTVLSRPDCRAACHSVFDPLANESGKLVASAFLGLLVAGH